MGDVIGRIQRSDSATMSFHRCPRRRSAVRGILLSARWLTISSFWRKVYQRLFSLLSSLLHSNITEPYRTAVDARTMATIHERCSLQLQRVIWRCVATDRVSRAHLTSEVFSKKKRKEKKRKEKNERRRLFSPGRILTTLGLFSRQ